MKRVISLAGLSIILWLWLSALPLGAQSNALPVGYYEEHDYRLTYVGSWNRPTGTQYLGGSATYTAVAGDKLTFTVDQGVGRLIIYRATYSFYPNFEVYQNGVLTNTVTHGTSPASGLFGQPVNISLIPGATVELRNVGACCMWIEAISLFPPSAALVQVITATPTPTLTPTSGPSPTPSQTPTPTPDYLENIQVTMAAGGRDVAIRYEVTPADLAMVSILFVIAGLCFIVAWIYVRNTRRQNT